MEGTRPEGGINSALQAREAAYSPTSIFFVAEPLTVSTL